MMIKWISLVFLTATTVWSAEWKVFDPLLYLEAKKAGKSIVLDFKAPWCGTCKVQKKVTDGLFQEEEFSSFVGFRVDFDHSIGLKKEFRVFRQSTLIVLKGHDEVGRSIADTNSDSVRTLLRKGI